MLPAPPVVLALHGFTGGGGDFAPLIAACPDYCWMIPDLPGHAPDPAAPGAPGDDCREAAGLAYLDGFTSAITTGPFVVLGYSLGGRLALRHALARPGRIAALVLVGTSPGIEDPAERAARHLEDEKLAQRIVDLGVPAFLEDWQRRPLIASQEKLPESWRKAMREQRGRLRPAGLAASLREFGQGAVEPVWNRLCELTMPVLVCAGVNDAKYAAEAAEMCRHCPSAELFLVPQAGHLAHLENRDVFIERLRRFLAERLP